MKEFAPSCSIEVWVTAGSGATNGRESGRIAAMCAWTNEIQENLNLVY